VLRWFAGLLRADFGRVEDDIVGRAEGETDLSSPVGTECPRYFSVACSSQPEHTRLLGQED
jgi:hypothetical protein